MTSAEYSGPRPKKDRGKAQKSLDSIQTKIEPCDGCKLVNEAEQESPRTILDGWGEAAL
jgi:hypothetical protein